MQLKIFKTIDLQNTLSDPNGIKLEIDNRAVKYPTIQKFKKDPYNILKKSQDELKKFEPNESENATY